MKWLSIAVSVLFACTVVSCSPRNPRTTEKMAYDTSVARSGAFAECIRMATLASDSILEAEFFKAKIDGSVGGTPEDWYFDTGEQAAARAIEQRRKAEEVCGNYMATKYARSGSMSPIAGKVKERVYFELGSAELTPTERNKLANVISSIKAEPASTVVLSGFTDTTGSVELNQRLSTQRAVTVFETLKALGRQSNITVVPERIEVLGRGEVGGPDNTSNADDRRVDVIVVPSTARAQMR